MSQSAVLCSIPPSAVERLVRNFEAFLQTIDDACQATTDGHAAKARWLRAQQVLQKQLVAVEAAVKAYTAGDSATIVKHADDLRMLARRMDGYPLDFAGSGFEEALTAKRRLLVLVAWQIHAASTGSGSAGL